MEIKILVYRDGVEYGKIIYSHNSHVPSAA